MTNIKMLCWLLGLGKSHDLDPEIQEPAALDFVAPG
jgi:hypothetical protein